MKKVLACLLSLVLALGSLPACNGSAPASSAGANSQATEANPHTTSQQSGGQPVNLTFWYWADTSDQSKVMQSVVKTFNETNGKNIHVTAQEYPWDGGKYPDSLFTAARGGGGPDLAMFKIVAGPMYVANNLLADLSSYENNWSDKSQFPDNLWNIMQEISSDKKTYIVPFSLEPLFFYYRPSYFKKAGVEVPKTWDEFLEAAKKTTMDTNGDGKIDVYGFGMRGGSGGQDALGNFLCAYGGSFDNLTTPEAVKGYQSYLDLFKKGYTPKSAPTADYNEMIDGFKSGKTAMIIHHIGSSSVWLQQYGDDVGAFVSPAGPTGKQWTVMGETELTMFKKCSNPDAGFEFIKYMTTGQGGADWFSGSGKGLPCTKIVQASKAYKDNRFMQVANDSLKIGGIMPLTDTITDFINNVYPGTNQQALLGQIDAAKAMKIMNDSIHGTK